MYLNFFQKLIILITLINLIPLVRSENIVPNLIKCSPSLSLSSFLVPIGLQQPLHFQQQAPLNESKVDPKFYNFSLIPPSKRFEANCQKYETFHFSTKNPNKTENETDTHPDPIDLPPEFSKNGQNYVYFFGAPGFFKFGTRAIHPKNYCLATISSDVDEIELRVCQNGAPTLAKCCPPGYAMVEVATEDKDHEEPYKCALVEGQPWQPLVYTKNGEQKHETVVKDDFGVNYEKFDTNCNLRFVLSLDGHTSNKCLGRIKIFDNGSTFTQSPFSNGNCGCKNDDKKNWEEESKGQFCVDELWDSDFQEEKGQILLKCDNKTNNNNVPGQGQQVSLIYSKIYFGAFIMSATFVLMIVLVHCLTWTYQNVHGWTVTMFCLTLGLANIFQAIASGLGLWGDPNLFLDSPGCIAVGVCTHFFFVSSFAWLTVLSFDLWSTITNMTPRSARSSGRKRFIGYCCFGFGVPLLVVSISLILDNTIDPCDDRFILPEYARSRCYLGDKSQIYYAIIANSILFGVNTLFALLTLWFLAKTKRAGSMMNNGKIRSTKESTSEFLLFGKLFVVCSLSWIFEIVSSFPDEKVTWYWAIFDLYNFFQAILLFWIFVVKKETKERLSKEYHIFRAAFNFLDNQKYIDATETDPLISLNRPSSTSPMTSSTVTGQQTSVSDP